MILSTIKLFDWKFEFDWSTFAAFLFGILFGIILIVGFYIYASLRSLRKSRYIVHKQVKELNQQEVEEMIKTAQNEFLARSKDKTDTKAFQEVCFNLVTNIAKTFYPNSKRPLAELTIDELILLGGYITKRVDELLSKRAIKMFKKMKLSTILSINDLKNSKPVQTVKKYKVPGFIKTVSMVANFVNPFYWFKRGIFDKTVNLILRKVSLVIIAICGDETYKIFSREVLVDEQEEYTRLVKEIEEDMAKLRKEEERNEWKSTEEELRYTDETLTMKRLEEIEKNKKKKKTKV